MVIDALPERPVLDKQVNAKVRTLPPGNELAGNDNEITLEDEIPKGVMVETAGTDASLSRLN